VAAIRGTAEVEIETTIDHLTETTVTTEAVTTEILEGRG